MRFTELRSGAPALALAFFAACGSETRDPPNTGGTPDAGTVVADAGFAPECTSRADCTTPAEPFCNPAGECAPAPAAGAIGWGDGSSTSVTFEHVFRPPIQREATDLDFNPERPNELWVLHRMPASTQPCTQAQPTRQGCGALEGSVTVIFDPASDGQREQWLQDYNAWHFMRRPTSLAFGSNGFLATCHEERTGNYLDGNGDFIGPTLWWSDFSMFGVNPPPEAWMNGTHFDMLHATPWCMGTAHEVDNIYWVFNGDVGSFDKYNFNEDHGPGAEDHGDGEIYRYAVGTLSRAPGIPSHMVFNPADRHLYAADTGNGRIVKLDTESGTRGRPVTPIYEPLRDNAMFDGAIVTDVVAPGFLTRPSGLVLQDNLLYVTDNATGHIHAFDLEGNEVRRLDTGFATGTLSSLTFSPDGYIYFADLTTSDVFRIVP